MGSGVGTVVLEESVVAGHAEDAIGFEAIEGLIDAWKEVPESANLERWGVGGYDLKKFAVSSADEIN